MTATQGQLPSQRYTILRDTSSCFLVDNLLINMENRLSNYDRLLIVGHQNSSFLNKVSKNIVLVMSIITIKYEW